MGDFNFWLPLLLSIPLAIAANLATGPIQRLLDSWSGRAPQRRLARLQARVRRATHAAAHERIALARMIISGFGHLSLMVLAFGARDIRTDPELIGSTHVIPVFNAAVEWRKVVALSGDALSIVSMTLATAALLLLLRSMSAYMDIDALPVLQKALADQSTEPGGVVGDPGG